MHSPFAVRIAAPIVAIAAVLPAQLQFSTLDGRALPWSEARSYAVAMGDVDRDGDLDAVFANDGQNRLCLNDGHGVFTDATAGRLPADADSSRAVALVDIDGDGDLDLLFGNFTTQSRLYLNDGNGRFTDVTAQRLPGNRDSTAALAVADIDRDGDQDLVLGNHGQDRLYTNDGAGRFTDRTGDLPAQVGMTNGVVCRDLDADGDVDMVLSGGPQNRLYLNDGRGRFTDASASRLPMRFGLYTRVVAGDVDGDGDLDLLFGEETQVNLWLNDGSGRFTDVTTTHLPFWSSVCSDLLLTDLDGDRDLDLVVARRSARLGSQQNQAYRNDGAGHFQDATAAFLPEDIDESWGVAAGDVDGDADLDLVFANAGQDRLYLRDGRGAFVNGSATRLPAVADLVRRVAAGDLDGDGDLDFVFASDGPDRVVLNDGHGRFATGALLGSLRDDTSGVALGDIDGDGDLDVVFTHRYRQTNRIYLNDGRGGLQFHQHAGSDGADPKLADVDGDGDLDLLMLVSGGPALFVNDGAGRFGQVLGRIPPVAGTAMALCDVDGDGDLDIALGVHLGCSLWGCAPARNRLLRNDGTGTFTDVTATSMPNVLEITTAVAAGDVDGDGDIDLVFGNAPDVFVIGQDRLYLNDGTGKFTDATSGRMPAARDRVGALAIGDVDGDGDLDVVVGNRGTGLRLFLNNGGGVFTDGSARLPPQQPDDVIDIALGDVDGDADLDLLSVRPGPWNGRMYLNLLRQLDAPVLPRLGRDHVLELYARHVPVGVTSLALPFVAIRPATVRLPPLGTLRLDPTAMLPLPAVPIPAATGIASVSVRVPPLPGLAGVSVYSQALMIHSPWMDRITGAAADRILR